jgi:hypothetical protein
VPSAPAAGGGAPTRWEVGQPKEWGARDGRCWAVRVLAGLPCRASDLCERVVYQPVRGDRVKRGNESLVQGWGPGRPRADGRRVRPAAAVDDSTRLIFDKYPAGASNSRLYWRVYRVEGQRPPEEDHGRVLACPGVSWRVLAGWAGPRREERLHPQQAVAARRLLHHHAPPQLQRRRHQGRRPNSGTSPRSRSTSPGFARKAAHHQPISHNVTKCYWTIHRPVCQSDEQADRMTTPAGAVAAAACHPVVRHGRGCHG